MNNIIKDMAYAIMKEAEESIQNEEPKYGIELFDSWIDCEKLALSALKAYEERSSKVQKEKDKFFGDLANECEADERF